MSIFEAFPGHTELATFEDVRRSLEGAVVRDAAGKMRPGVIFNQPGALVTGRNDMRVTIGDFRAVQDRGGAIFFGNQGQTVFPPTDEAPWPAAPAANRRIDLLWASSLSTRLGDSESGMTWGIIEGTPSATPVAPELPAALSGALEFATVEIPAGATSLTSPGVIITPKYQYTAMAGGTVTMRNTVELAAWTPADGARAHVLANNGDYVREDGSWRRASGSKVLATSVGWFLDGDQTITLNEPISEQPNGIVIVWSRYTSGSAENIYWSHQFIPKESATPDTGRSHVFQTVASTNGSLVGYKVVYVISDTEITGLQTNREAPNNRMVLRAVYGY